MKLTPPPMAKAAAGIPAAAQKVLAVQHVRPRIPPPRAAVCADRRAVVRALSAAGEHGGGQRKESAQWVSNDLPQRESC